MAIFFMKQKIENLFGGRKKNTGKLFISLCTNNKLPSGWVRFLVEAVRELGLWIILTKSNQIIEMGGEILMLGAKRG